MDSSERSALTLVRLVGFALVCITLLDLGLYLVKCYNPKDPHPLQVLPLVWHTIPILAGIGIFIKARAIAEWVSNILDL